MLDSHFNLTNKSNLIDRLQYDLKQFFDHLVLVAYFLGRPVYMIERHDEQKLWSFFLQFLPSQVTPSSWSPDTQRYGQYLVHV